jgi:hypothetical protein
MTLADLRQKFRQSKDYTHEMLVRDLIEYATEADKRVAAAEARLTAMEGEGTWTPSLQFAGVSTGITYASRRGSWKKIGKLVYIDFEFWLTSKGAAAGNAEMAGIPQTVDVTRPLVLSCGYYTGWVLPAGSVLSGFGYSTAAYPNFRANSNGDTLNVLNTHMTNASRVIGSGLYLAAA